MTFCPNCGNAVSEKFPFCNKCGKPIPGPTVPPPTVPPGPQAPVATPPYTHSTIIYGPTPSPSPPPPPLVQVVRPVYVQPFDVNMIKGKTLIFSVIGFALVFICLVTPWYYGTSEYKTEYGAYKSVGQMPLSVIYGSEFQSLVFSVTLVLMIFAFVLTTLFLFLVLMNISGLKFGKKIMKMIIPVAVILTLLAPIIFGVALPPAIKSDDERSSKANNDDYTAPDHTDPSNSFFGSYENKDEYDNTSTNNSWGGGLGWFLSFIAFMFLLLAYINFRKIKDAL